jgi:hypothetical protein
MRRGELFALVFYPLKEFLDMVGMMSFDLLVWGLRIIQPVKFYSCRDKSTLGAV